MYVRVITFRLDGLEPAAYRAHASALAPAFAQWPGLLRKIWLADGPDGRLGGIYVFTDKAAADASRDTDPFRGMTTNPHFTDLKVEEFDVFDDLTSITTQETAA